MATPLHHAEWVELRHYLFRIYAVIAWSALVANILPKHTIFDRKPMRAFLFDIAVFCVAAFSLNWRAELPSLDGEWMGFKARVRDNESIRNVKRRLHLRRKKRGCK